MPNQILIRRGLEADRTSIIPVDGEPIWCSDTKRLFMGDGATAGGIMMNHSQHMVPFLIDDNPIVESAATTWKQVKSVRFLKNSLTLYPTVSPSRIRCITSVAMSSSTYTGHARLIVYSGAGAQASSADYTTTSTAEAPLVFDVDVSSLANGFYTAKLEIYRTGGTMTTTYWELDFIF